MMVPIKTQEQPKRNILKETSIGWRRHLKIIQIAFITYLSEERERGSEGERERKGERERGREREAEEVRIQFIEVDTRGEGL